MDQPISIRAQSADNEQHGRDAAHQRSDARNNMFVVAALTSDKGSGPIRIRNMSRGGALVEGPVIPPAGSRLLLSRASLSVAGEIVWREESRAGIRFDVAILVGDWLPAGARGTGQQRIDEIVHIHKTRFAAAPASPAAPQPTSGGSTELAAELGAVAAAIAAAADELASDIATIKRHPRALQILDATAQQVENLVNRLTSAPLGPSSP